MWFSIRLHWINVYRSYIRCARSAESKWHWECHQWSLLLASMKGDAHVPLKGCIWLQKGFRGWNPLVKCELMKWQNTYWFIFHYMFHWSWYTDWNGCLSSHCHKRASHPIVMGIAMYVWMLNYVILNLGLRWSPSNGCASLDFSSEVMFKYFRISTWGIIQKL